MVYLSRSVFRSPFEHMRSLQAHTVSDAVEHASFVETSRQVIVPPELQEIEFCSQRLSVVVRDHMAQIGLELTALRSTK